MPEIYHDLVIHSTPALIFRAISSPDGLNAWWTARSAGKPAHGELYTFWFAPEYDWRAEVTSCVQNRELSWKITEADEDWTGTKIVFNLVPDDKITRVRFSHTGWKSVNDHFRRTSYCWAIYLNGLKKYLEEGIIRPFESRGSV